MGLKIYIAGHEMTKFQEVTLKLQYDSLADTFAIKGDYNPNNVADKAMFKPCAFQTALILWERAPNQVFPLMTGTVTGIDLSDLPAPTLNTISGYSNTGILQDCQVVEQSMQFDAQTIAQIATTICGYFNLQVVIDPSVSDVCNTVNAVTSIDILQTAGNYLGEICRNYNIVLSHTANGHVLLTSAKKVIVPVTVPISATTNTNQIVTEIAGIQYTTYNDNRYTEQAKPAFSFTASGKGQHYTKMTLRTDGEKMHSRIFVTGQSQGRTLGPLQNFKDNPYVPKRIGFYAPTISLYQYRQRAVVNTVDPGPLKPLTARNVLADELKSISLDIDVPAWFLGASGTEGDSAYSEGTFIRPNILVSVQNPELYLFKANLWFVESVTLNHTPAARTATLHCVLPQCFNNEEVTVNIFE